MLFHILKKLGFYSSSFFLICTWNSSARIPQEDAPSIRLKDKKISERADLNLNLKRQLSQVLSLMAEVHESIKKNHYEQFQMQVSEVIKQLKQINVFREPQLTYHQRNYLARQLRTVKENLRFVRFGGDFQDQSMRILSRVNKELIHISQMYSLDNHLPQQYSVYFCSRTENAWIQKSNSKVYNPFQKGYRNCGRKIR